MCGRCEADRTGANNRDRQAALRSAFHSPALHCQPLLQANPAAVAACCRVARILKLTLLTRRMKLIRRTLRFANAPPRAGEHLLAAHNEGLTGDPWMGESRTSRSPLKGPSLL